MSQNDGKRIVGYHPKYEPIAETLRRVAQQAESRTGEPELKTGLEIIDKGIHGLQRSALTIIAARPGNGKSSLVCQIAFNLADNGKEVALVSLEMTRESVVSKIFCNQNKIDSFDFMHKKHSLSTADRLESFIKIVELMPLRIIDDYCYTADELYTLIEHLEYRPDVLILDHLNHIRIGNMGRMSEREVLSEYLKYLKEIAKKYNIAVVCVCQINREGDDKPTIKTIKGTGAADELADHVFLLHVERQHQELMSGNLDGNLENATIDLAKSRFGITGFRKVLFDGKHGRFLNIELARKQEDSKWYQSQGEEG